MSDELEFLHDLSPETKAFLKGLGKEDVETLAEGVKLVTSIKRVGKAVRIVIVFILGMAVGTVMFFDAIGKIMAGVKSWFGG